MLKSMILAAGLAVAAPALAEPLTVLPNGLPVTEVTVDGHGPYRFVIDTAASSTVVLPAFRQVHPVALAAAASPTISGAAGDTRVDLTPLGPLKVAGRVETGVEAFSLPPSPIDDLGVHGILGADVVAGYALEIDGPAGRWALLDRAPDTPSDHVAVAFTLDEAKAPRLTVLVDGRAIPAVLDTGARGTIMNWHAARLLGAAPADAGLEAAGTARGVSAHGAGLVRRDFGDLAIGEARRAQPTLHIADMPVFEVLGLADGPGMILGMDMLGGGRFVVDYPGRRLILPAAGPARAPVAD